ncbi:MAG: hypothetical protein MZV49_09465 [Rhodopseudomonas palustris]|nr:hypothetical protein [Rhodopseudomonas palustris]
MSTHARQHVAQPDAAARRRGACATAMFARRPRLARPRACSIEAVGPGYARCAMTVRRDMLNGFAHLPRRLHHHAGRHAPSPSPATATTR